MKFIGYCNGGQTKIQCANVSDALYTEIEIPVTTNGFIATGHQNNNMCLVVIDFNMNRNGNKTINPEQLNDWCKQDKTFIVRSGGGNLHYYFLLTDGEYNTFEFSEDAETLTFNALTLEISKIDILANGSKVFAPGCKFAEHSLKEYAIINAAEPMRITTAEFKIMLEYLVDLKNPNSVILSNDIMQSMIITDEILLRENTTRDDFNSKDWIPMIGDWFNASGINCYFIIETKVWVLYINGVYRTIDESQIVHIVRVWLNQNDMKLSDINVGCALKEIIDRKTKSIKLFNRDNTVVNVLNGLYQQSTKKILPHTPKLKTTEQFNFNFTKTPKPTPYINKLFEIYPEQMTVIKRYLQSILYNDYRIGLMLFMYGKTGSAKGTILRMIYKVLEFVTTNMSVCTIGDGWNLQELIGKRTNIDQDANMSSMSDKTMTVLKKIVDPEKQPIPIPIIYGGVKTMELDTFFITATNMLAKMPKMTDLLAFFKRVYIIVLDHQFSDDRKFSDGVFNEADDFFSRLLLEPYTPLDCRVVNAKQHATKMMKLWYFYSNPIRAACSDIFERVTKSDTDNFAKFRIDCLEAVEIVRDYIAREKYDVDLENTNLSWHVTNTLGRMDIEKRKLNNGNDFCYYPVKIKPYTLVDIYLRRNYNILSIDDNKDATNHTEKLNTIIVTVVENIKDDERFFDISDTDVKSYLLDIISKTKMSVINLNDESIITCIEKRDRITGEKHENRSIDVNEIMSEIDNGIYETDDDHEKKE